MRNLVISCVGLWVELGWVKNEPTYNSGLIPPVGVPYRPDPHLTRRCQGVSTSAVADKSNHIAIGGRAPTDAVDRVDVPPSKMSPGGRTTVADTATGTVTQP